MKKLIVLGATALIALGAAACGRMADLEAPPARQTERAPRGDWGGNVPEPATINRPNSEVPIDGGPSSSPYGGAGSRPN